MTSKRVRVLLAAGLMLVLCGGCFGNCLTDFFEGLRSPRSDGYGSGYDYVTEADAGPSDAFGDAGVE